MLLRNEPSVEQLQHRQCRESAAAPQQIRTGGCSLTPVLVAVEAAIGQAQHARTQARKQFLAQLPLPAAVWTDVGTQDGVRGALDQDDAARLRIAGMAGHAGATAGVAEGRGVIGLVRQLEATAVNGHQAPTGIERLWVLACIGQWHAASPHEFGQRCSTDPAAQPADRRLANPCRLRRPAGPGQALRDDGEHLLVGRLRIQAQRHAVVHTRDGREAAHALAVAAMRIQHRVHASAGTTRASRLAREIVAQPRPRAQHRLRSRHDITRRRVATAVIVHQIRLKQQYWVRLEVRPHHRVEWAPSTK